MSNMVAEGEELIHEVGLIIRIPIRLAKEIEFGDNLEDYTILTETIVGTLVEELHAILEQELGIVSRRKVVVKPKIIVGDFVEIPRAMVIIRCPQCFSEIAIDESTVYPIDCDCGREITEEEARCGDKNE